MEENVLNGNKQKKDADSPDLTDREQEVLKLLINGMSLKEIASSLGISYKTVDFHRGNIYRKFDIQSMQELFALSFRNQSDWNPNGIFLPFAAYKDNLGSKIIVTVKEEEIQKKHFTCYYMKGNLSNEQKVYAGIFIEPNCAALDIIKKSTSYSFNILGDGNTYEAMLTTSDSRIRGEENHFRKTFNTEKNKTAVINVNISELTQSALFGKKVNFIQSNVEGIKFQISNGNKYNLKIWDIQFQQNIGNNPD